VSKDVAAELIALSLSVASITILFPPIISTDEPVGIGMFLTRYGASPEVGLN
jgi:hypothetical protein